ncbi:MAG TPA: LysM peptidoglycan-binding domain-containing protein [Campylobacterales bacterium]|nr:LysM peptidoglycan-binding domain-containing protein [Campylobacterales bacterium]
MFKKKQNIDHEFMQYSADDSSQSEKSEKSFLSTIIQTLTILVLLGVLIAGGIFGYKFLQNDASSKVAAPIVEDPIPVTKAAKEQKMYTQDEMQSIMQAMMVKLEKKQQENSIDASTSDSSEDSLLASLENMQVDQMEDINLDVDFSKSDKSKKITTKNSDENVDRYNKAVVKQSANTYAQVDALSIEISNMVKELESKPATKSTYTESITKEVSVRENEMRIIVVKSGDTLSKIAKRAYGSAQAYDRIYNANPDLIKNPNHIFVGQRLRVPLEEI